MHDKENLFRGAGGKLKFIVLSLMLLLHVTGACLNYPLQSSVCSACWQALFLQASQA
jgi:hypothetical protein